MGEPCGVPISGGSELAPEHSQQIQVRIGIEQQDSALERSDSAIAIVRLGLS